MNELRNKCLTEYQDIIIEEPFKAKNQQKISKTKSTPIDCLIGDQTHSSSSPAKNRNLHQKFQIKNMVLSNDVKGISPYHSALDDYVLSDEELLFHQRLIENSSKSSESSEDEIIDSKTEGVTFKQNKKHKDSFLISITRQMFKKHKIIKNKKMLADKKSQNLSLPHSDSSDPDLLFLRKAVENCSSSESSEEALVIPIAIQNEVKNAVKSFLLPYICNEITPEQDEMRELPFLTVITEELYGKYGINNMDEFQGYVLYYYIDFAVRGLYSNWHLEEMMPAGNIKSLTRPTYLKIFHVELSKDERYALLSDRQYHELQAWYDQWILKELSYQDYYEVITWTRQKIQEKNLNKSHPEFSKSFLILLRALLPAIKKDFSRTNIKIVDILTSTLKILMIVDDGRMDEYDQCLKEIKENEEEAHKIASARKLVNECV